MSFKINRRRFLQTASASLALSALGAEALDSFSKPRRVGLIGTGWYGKSDLFRLIQVAPVEVVSLCDVDKRMLAEAAEMVGQRQKSRKTPRTYADYREMLREKDLDIVLIGTPGSLARAADDRGRRGRGGRLRAEADQRGCAEGEAMLAAARKHQRVVQVGTQRKSTPHLIEAKKNIVDAGLAGQGRPRGDVLLLPHAGQRQSAGRSPCPISSTTRCGPGRRRCGPTTACRTSAGGARSWNTATASWATCACTCWTPPAGCWGWAGPSASAPRAASSCRRTASRTSPTPRPRRSNTTT